MSMFQKSQNMSIVWRDISEFREFVEFEQWSAITLGGTCWTCRECVRVTFPDKSALLRRWLDVFLERGQDFHTPIGKCVLYVEIRLRRVIWSTCISWLREHHKIRNINVILQWVSNNRRWLGALTRQIQTFCAHDTFLWMRWFAACQVSRNIAPNAYVSIRVDDYSDFMTFAEIPDIFLRIFKLQWRLCSLYRQNELMYFTDFQLCIFHEAQHNKNIALYEHIQIMRHMQCFVLGSVGFQQYQADSTAQCTLQFSVA